MTRNIAAYTPPPQHPEYYPPYVSINRIGGDPGSEVEITVRGREKSAGVCGPVASIIIPARQFDELVESTRRALEEELPDGIKGAR